MKEETKKPDRRGRASVVAEAGFVIVSKKRLPEQELPTGGRTGESGRRKTKKPDHDGRASVVAEAGFERATSRL